ncbi:hypothetical protein OK015_18080 [Mycobacterium sp. Aquia_216]|uniref:hypothetical protein n=1 Tax=Mycobacterium sp. Aquia_216 TaxID=2991729 RepID=UPI00227D2C22|nr:hypothetical protein [Mycobacterium sp. Aquia_216]WAJ43129.1 hypothetical protein OK015_18080 [Mycobacterium sp. Aquia_216]
MTDFDDDEPDDDGGETGAVALMCQTVVTHTRAQIRFFDDLSTALHADRQPCPWDTCTGAHSFAVRDADGEIRTWPTRTRPKPEAPMRTAAEDPELVLQRLRVVAEQRSELRKGRRRQHLPDVPTRNRTPNLHKGKG